MKMKRKLQIDLLRYSAVNWMVTSLYYLLRCDVLLYCPSGILTLLHNLHAYLFTRICLHAHDFKPQEVSRVNER